MNLVLGVVLAALIPLPADSAFAPWFTSRGVQVEIARQAQGPPWLRGTAELPAAAETVWRVLTDYRHYKEFFSPAVKTAAVLEESNGWARIHIVWPYPFPYKNRDAAIRYRGEKTASGSFLLSWKSDPRPGDPQEGLRIEDVAGDTRVEPLDPERCKITYTYFGDLGGKFPGWAQEKAWREEPVQYFRAVRRRLKLPDVPP